MAERWYYSKDGQKSGPISLDELKQLAAAGEIPPATLVWTEGMAQWTPAGKIDELGLPAGQPAPSQSPVDEYGVQASPPELPSSGPAAAPQPARPVTMPLPRRTATAPIDYAALTKPFHFAQIACWGVCAGLMVLGLFIFLVVLIAVDNAQSRAAAGAIFATIFLSIYGLCRAVEKLARLLLNPPKDDG